MEHSANTKLNDAVTYRQFSRFLVHAEIPPTWKQPVIALEDVIKMPVIYHHIPHVKTERKNKRFLKDFTKSKPDNKKKRFRQASELGLFM